MRAASVATTMTQPWTTPVGPPRPGARTRARRACLLLALLPAVCAAQLSASAQREIDGLLRAVGSSGCQFLRGGTAHPAAEAQQHLHKKYSHLAARNMLVSAEDFIDKAASRSSMNGEPYAIRCGESPPVRSDEWLRARLQIIRQASAPR